ncbi:MAG: hypothetical protein SVW77_00795 [Candidatus Nanohaloarchaea archaeon]|nr:hypothetical protein [Candidatus Nanohaloarchaea archaeon]
MTLFEFARRIYHAKGYRCYPLPVQSVISIGLQLAEFVPFIPRGADQARFLRFDNTVEANDAAEYLELTPLDAWLADVF